MKAFLEDLGQAAKLVVVEGKGLAKSTLLVSTTSLPTGATLRGGTAGKLSPVIRAVLELLHQCLALSVAYQ